MLKKLSLLVSLAAGLALLNGCTLTKPQNQQELCTQMKRQMIFRSSNPNHEAAWTTHAQKEQFKQKMRENNCL